MTREISLLRQYVPKQSVAFDDRRVDEQQVGRAEALQYAGGECRDFRRLGHIAGQGQTILRAEVSGERSVAQALTVQPAALNPRASARPRPREVPVMRTWCMGGIGEGSAGRASSSSGFWRVVLLDSSKRSHVADLEHNYAPVSPVETGALLFQESPTSRPCPLQTSPNGLLSKRRRGTKQAITRSQNITHPKPGWSSPRSRPRRVWPILRNSRVIRFISARSSIRSFNPSRTPAPLFSGFIAAVLEYAGKHAAGLPDGSAIPTCRSQFSASA
jgi:hypothetical protein